jgi:hypothetical protein
MKQNAKIAEYKDFCSSNDIDSEVHSFFIATHFPKENTNE